MQKLALVLQREESDLAFAAGSDGNGTSSAPLRARRGSMAPEGSDDLQVRLQSRQTNAAPTIQCGSAWATRRLRCEAWSPTERLFQTPSKRDYGTPSPDPRWMRWTALAAIPAATGRHLRNSARQVWCASALGDLALLELRAPLPARIRSCASSFPDFRVLATLTSVLPVGAELLIKVANSEAARW